MQHSLGPAKNYTLRGTPRTFVSSQSWLFQTQVYLNNVHLVWGNPKQHMKLQQPRNYDFGCSNSTSWGPKAETAVK